MKRLANTAQDPRDEPATAALERIKQERNRA
jgi:hypothetical protein